MRESISFDEWMVLVAEGNQDAAAELVRLLEPRIHRAVRRYLRSSSLSRELDAHDVSQVVLTKFFVGNLAVRCDIDHLDQLTHLLVRMARNKIRDEIRKQRARRRIQMAIEPLETITLAAKATSDSCPIRTVTSKELMHAIYMRLDEDERHLARQRRLGMDWSTIAAKEGKSSEAVRKKLARAMARVRQELGL